MSQSITPVAIQPGAQASLAALVAHMQSRGIFQEVRAGVHLAQKTVKDSPQDKVQDILLALLAGTQSLVQLNTLLRQDAGLLQAAGRERCAEQSVAQQTLDAATPENVEEVQQVLTRLLHRHSQVARHPFGGQWLILDADLTGLPAGKRAEQSVKGYFSQPRKRRGRQQGRVLASQYGEIVVDALYPGNTLQVQVLPELIAQAEQVLRLKPSQRRRTIVRVDGGGGSIDAVNTLLEHDYAVVTKDYSFRRTQRMVKSVGEWVPDSTQPNRQMGWVQEQSSDYVRPVRRLAVRSRSTKGRWQSAVLLFANLSDFDLLTLMGERPTTDAATIMGAYLHFYDQRGGGIESSFGQDKSGLGITKRSASSCCWARWPITWYCGRAAGWRPAVPKRRSACSTTGSNALFVISITSAGPCILTRRDGFPPSRLMRPIRSRSSCSSHCVSCSLLLPLSLFWTKLRQYVKKTNSQKKWRL